MITLATHESAPQVESQPHQRESSVSETTFTFRSKLPDIDISNNIPLHAYCFEKISESCDRPCLINGSTGHTYTFAETHLLSRKVAAGLSALGIQHGDVVMLLLQNCVEFAFTFMGASMIGATTTAANPFCKPHEILKQYKASDAKLIVTHSLYVEKLRDDFPKIGEELTVITVDNPPEGCLDFWILTDTNESAIPDVTIDPHDTVALPFSSGTTGLPKGVVLTHKSLVTSIAQQVDGDNPNLDFTTNDVVLCVLPLFHIFSLSSVLLCSLRTGSAVLLMRKFEMATLLGLIERHRVSVAPVVPPLVLALAENPMVDNYDLSSVRIVLSGAAPLGKGLEEALRNRVPQAIFGQGYGMTEAGPVLSMCPSLAKQPLPSKSGSCGTVVRNAELKVIDPETGLSLRHNQPGEICIRGQQIMKGWLILPSVHVNRILIAIPGFLCSGSEVVVSTFEGYLNDVEATSRTIDVEGWLHTGDIGYVDDDEEVFIVDRVKELIKFKGFQVPPAELESLLIGHPSIADAAVVPQNDEATGEVPVAFVVRSIIGLDITEEAIKEFIAKQVVFYKRLHKVYFIHAIPKSPSGKILRKDLKAKLATYS